MRTTVALSILSMLILSGGCAKTATTTGPDQPSNTEPQLTPDTSGLIRELDLRVDELVKESRALPGRDDAEHQRLMAAAFAKCAEILPAIQGPDPPGAFRQQLAIIQSAHTQLAGHSPNPDATVSIALRAVYGALAGIYRDQFYEQTEIATPLDALRSRIDELDRVQGATHEFVAGQAMQQAAAIMKQMTTILMQRAGTATPTTNTTTTTPVAVAR